MWEYRVVLTVCAVVCCCYCCCCSAQLKCPLSRRRSLGLLRLGRLSRHLRRCQPDSHAAVCARQYECTVSRCIALCAGGGARGNGATMVRACAGGLGGTSRMLAAKRESA